MSVLELIGQHASRLSNYLYILHNTIVAKYVFMQLAFSQFAGMSL